MREIIYRIWDEKVKRYVQDHDDFFIDPDGALHTIDIYEGADRFCSPGRYIIEQYTGLKDKNGKKIFEGCIVICRAGETYQGRSEHEATVTVELGFTQAMWEMLQYDNLEIIGNIHEEVTENE